ncbi:MAG: M23 family metallopeptidase [bacterium]
MTKYLKHPLVKKYVNKKTLFWFAIFKLVTYIIIGGFFFASTLEANAAKINTQVKVASENRVYFIDTKALRKKAYNNEASFFSYGHKFSGVTTITADQINQYPDAKLIKEKNKANIYLISGGKKCTVTGPSQLKKLNLSKEPVLTVNLTDLRSYRNAKCSDLTAPIGGSDSYNDYYTAKYTDETTTDYNYVGATMFSQSNGTYAPGTKNNILGTFVISNDGPDPILLREVTIVTTNQDIKSSHGFYNLAVGLANTRKKLGYTAFPQETKNKITLGRYELPSHQSVTLNITIDTFSYAPIGTISNTLTKLDFDNKKTHTAASIEGSGNQVVLANGQLVAIAAGNTYNETTSETTTPVNTKTQATKNTVTSTSSTKESEFVWPTTSREINYYFNDPNYPFANEFEHNGIDINAHQGSSVFAAHSGTVVQVMNNKDASFNYIRIRDANGLETGYGHLSRVDVVLDQEITKSAKIGLSGGTPGTTGSGQYSTGPHLHFEVIEYGQFVDPMTFLK